MSKSETPVRPVIYQLLVRTFGNTKTNRKPGGTLAENGCGKFRDINDAALTAIREMGFNHIWLTGVLEQASGTAYPGRLADPPEILKGVAGSPYAIRDYFDVCPDYAEEPENRIAEFRELLARCRRRGLRTIIDFVPNHVARSYASDVRPELSFGEGDRRDVFFERDNHFYYLNESHPGGAPPLKLPTGLFSPETEFGRVTGNNSVTWSPTINEWYETVKLNYGHDFTTGRRTSHLSLTEDVPRTWRTMDAIIAYWQEMGVDGFRTDMAHMVPMEFWQWMVKGARARDAGVLFIAEAYDGDPAKLTDADVLDELWKAGFDGAYEHPTYKILQGIYECGKWANDIDGETFGGERFHHSVRYIENHDEVRVANPQHWGGAGMNAGKPAAAVMFGMSRAAIMLYSGQEIGEPAIGAEGFSGDDGRTSIFDYTAMPEFQKWFNGGKCDGAKLSPAQKALRKWYGDLLTILREPAFTAGDFYGLNHANKQNLAFGRVGGETCSGHWLYAFLRRDAESGQAFLCLANFHPTESLADLRVIIPEHALAWMGRGAEIAFVGKLGCVDTFISNVRELPVTGLKVGKMEPFGVHYYALK